VLSINTWEELQYSENESHNLQHDRFGTVASQSEARAAQSELSALTRASCIGQADGHFVCNNGMEGDRPASKKGELETRGRSECRSVFVDGKEDGSSDNKCRSTAEDGSSAGEAQ